MLLQLGVVELLIKFYLFHFSHLVNLHGRIICKILYHFKDAHLLRHLKIVHNVFTEFLFELIDINLAFPRKEIWNHITITFDQPLFPVLPQ